MTRTRRRSRSRGVLPGVCGAGVRRLLGAEDGVVAPGLRRDLVDAWYARNEPVNRRHGYPFALASARNVGVSYSIILR